jgi:hypothetical protein
MTMPQARQPDQPAAGARLARPDSAKAGQDDDRAPRPLEVAECSLCGIARPLGLLVPDGGGACADVRWYCKDVKSCTDRWATARPLRSAGRPAAPGDAVAEPAPACAPAKTGGTPEEAQPVMT